MSHSKFTKRGRSLYIESWNPAAKRFINTCKICGYQGYSPGIEQEGFLDDQIHRVIYAELKKTLPRLELDEFGRCEACARAQDNSSN